MAVVAWWGASGGVVVQWWGASGGVVVGGGGWLRPTLTVERAGPSERARRDSTAGAGERARALATEAKDREAQSTHSEPHVRRSDRLTKVEPRTQEASNRTNPLLLRGPLTRNSELR